VPCDYLLSMFFMDPQNRESRPGGDFVDDIIWGRTGITAGIAQSLRVWHGRKAVRALPEAAHNQEQMVL